MTDCQVKRKKAAWLQRGKQKIKSIFKRLEGLGATFLLTSFSKCSLVDMNCPTSKEEKVIVQSEQAQQKCWWLVLFPCVWSNIALGRWCRKKGRTVDQFCYSTNGQEQLSLSKNQNPRQVTRALEIVFVFFFLNLLASLCGVWDLSSLTRDRTHAPCIGNRVLITGLTGKSPRNRFNRFKPSSLELHPTVLTLKHEALISQLGNNL